MELISQLEAEILQASRGQAVELQIGLFMLMASAESCKSGGMDQVLSIL